MFSLSHVLTVCVALLSLSMFAHGRRVAQRKRDCSLNCIPTFRCNVYEDAPVWAIVDGQCEVFKNGCLFATENCGRQNQCLPEMTPITKEECQPYCHYCQADSDSVPVCGAYYKLEADGTATTEYKTFNSRCDLKRKSCDKAKAYVFRSEGACPSEEQRKG